MHQAKKDVMNFSNVKLYLYKIFVGFIYNLTDQNWFYGFCKNMEIEENVYLQYRAIDSTIFNEPTSLLNRKKYKTYEME